MKLFSKVGSAITTTLTTVLLLTGTLVAFAQPSPVGVIWDCVLSGHRDGTAYLEFFDDGTGRGGTFSVFEALVPLNPKPSEVGEGRNVGGDAPRGDPATPPTVFTPGRQIFGFESVTNSPWFFDNKGRVIGYFIETSRLESCVTNAFPIVGGTNSFSSPFPLSGTNGSPSDPSFCITSAIATNSISVTNPPFLSSIPISGPTTNGCIASTIETNGIDSYTIQEVCFTISGYTNQTICYTNIISCSALTNAISFVGKVVPDRRLTLVATTPFGKTTYRGVPAQELPNISGPWYGTKKQNGVVFQEFFTLSPSSPSDSLGFPNVYDVTGAGPGYSYRGISILSSRKRISFVFGLDPPLPTDEVTIVRAVTGPFNPKKVAATTKGFDQPDGTFTNPIIFKAARFAE